MSYRIRCDFRGVMQQFHFRIEATANSAVSWLTPTDTQASLCSRSYTP